MSGEVAELMGPRYDLTRSPATTPPFVLWSLAHACSLKADIDPHAPEAAERLLRGVRCYSDAVVEQRVLYDVVWQTAADEDGPLGFSVPSVLEPLGGLPEIAAACTGCPANALAVHEPAALAGCVGVVVPPSDKASDFFVQLTEVHRQAATQLQSPVGVAGWYGLWWEPEPTAVTLEMWYAAWSTYLSQAKNLPPEQQAYGVHDFLAAVSISQREKICLRIQVYPAGTCAERRWELPAHCGRCSSPWPERKRQQCPACGQVGGRQAERTRKRIGSRPYRPLSEFLTAEEIAALTARSPRSA